MCIYGDNYVITCVYIYIIYTYIRVDIGNYTSYKHMYVNLFYIGYTSIHITSYDTNRVCCSHLPSEFFSPWPDSRSLLSRTKVCTFKDLSENQWQTWAFHGDLTGDLMGRNGDVPWDFMVEMFIHMLHGSCMGLSVSNRTCCPLSPDFWIDFFDNCSEASK